MKTNQSVVHWTTEEDINLMSRVKEAIRDNKAITMGVKRFIRETNSERSLGACMFRWSSVLKNRPEWVPLNPQSNQSSNIDNKSIETEVVKININEISVDLLSKLQELILNRDALALENEKLVQKNRELSKENNELHDVNKQLTTDNEYFYKIFNKARTMSLEEGKVETPEEKPRFKMDRNGNLERR